ncbi:hypothetical protein FVEG_10264 [Fusarium verticillioides 7600]|uniref:Uncharacterized protein n=1 Tax=Gibberella moniliformis (strain M3125 / FGSC 7600) TaxID=334819 RepID=W7MTW0_GIBM7|nr:hypothetical protein FVEG_10264 [Fusarium verticillioides 7600]EWG51194.1 hypothetical protein FVEG_10264 [Fusarium verticillioides 7600]
MPISGAAGTEGANNARRAIQDQKKSTISLPIASNSLRPYVKKEARSRLGTKFLKGCTAEKNRSEDVRPKSILVHLYARVESPRSGMDSDLEAFSRYPADGSSAAPPGRTAAKTNYLNERFQSPAAIRGDQTHQFHRPREGDGKVMEGSQQNEGLRGVGGVPGVWCQGQGQWQMRLFYTPCATYFLTAQHQLTTPWPGNCLLLEVT